MKTINKSVIVKALVALKAESQALTQKAHDAIFGFSVESNKDLSSIQHIVTTASVKELELQLIPLARFTQEELESMSADDLFNDLDAKRSSFAELLVDRYRLGSLSIHAEALTSARHFIKNTLAESLKF
jgi:hypothetical protein